MPRAMTLEDMPELLTVKEAARLLRISKNQAYKELDRPEKPGTIPAIWLGHRCVVPKRALLRMLQGDRGKEAV